MVLDPSNDLLAFVSNLQEESNLDAIRVPRRIKKSSSSKPPKKGPEPTLQETKPKIASLEDFFSALPKEARKRASIVPDPTPAPLPAIKQAKFERQIAYEHTTEDISKWEPLVKQQQETHNLHFPLHAPHAPNLTADSLLTTFIPQNDFERHFAQILQKYKQDSSQQETEMRLSDHEPDKSVSEKAKQRAKDLYLLTKQKHISNIKSKTYRKHLARSKAKKLMKAQIANLNNTPTVYEQEKSREAAELARVRERLILKTQKASKWAHELLLSGKKDKAFRASVTQQVREQELLRQKIMGEARNEDVESAVEDTELIKEIQEELEDFQNSLGVLPSTKDSEDIQPGRQGRRTFGNFSPVGAPTEPQNISLKIPPEFDTKDKNGVAENEESVHFDDDPFAKIVSSRLEHNQHLAQMIFNQEVDDEDDKGNEEEKIADVDDELSDDGSFARLKQQIVEADAPKVEDVTLPGWGHWSGPSSSKHSSTTHVQNVTVLKRTPGVEKSQRRDAHLPRVILTERKLKIAESKYTINKVPLPFSNREQYEQVLARPLGPEWNTAGAYRRQIRPKVSVTPGAIIKPPKIPQLNK